MIETSKLGVTFLSYDEAWIYCACSIENGYSDWRIPTPTELIEIKRTNVGGFLPYNPWTTIHPTKVIRLVHSEIKKPLIPVRDIND